MSQGAGDGPLFQFSDGVKHKFNLTLRLAQWTGDASPKLGISYPILAAFIDDPVQFVRRQPPVKARIVSALGVRGHPSTVLIYIKIQRRALTSNAGDMRKESSISCHWPGILLITVLIGTVNAMAHTLPVSFLTLVADEREVHLELTV